MSEPTQDGGSLSQVTKSEPSWLARLVPNKAPTVPPKWPSPEESVGKRCYNIGFMTFWEIKDPRREKLVPLELEVQQLLNTHNEHLMQREASNLSFSIFMVGRHETASCPILVIISTNKKSRQRVVDTIRRSGILEKYEGVLLGGSSKHPRYPDSGPAQYIPFDTEDGPSRTFVLGVAVYIKKSVSQVTSGTAIYIPHDTISPEVSQLGRFRKATLGGFLELKRQDGTSLTVGMTAAHVFPQLEFDDDTSDQSEAPEDDTFEFDFNSPTPDTIFSDDSSANSSLKSCRFSPASLKSLPV
jgi:hypothetical protein